MSLLSRLVITFLLRIKHLLISWLQSPSAVIWEPPKIKSATVSTVSPSICHEVSGNSVRLYFGGALKSLQMGNAAMKLKLAPWNNPLQYCCLENPMDGGAW